MFYRTVALSCVLSSCRYLAQCDKTHERATVQQNERDRDIDIRSHTFQFCRFLASFVVLSPVLCQCRCRKKSTVRNKSVTHIRRVASVHEVLRNASNTPTTRPQRVSNAFVKSLNASNARTNAIEPKIDFVDAYKYELFP